MRVDAGRALGSRTWRSGADVDVRPTDVRPTDVRPTDVRPTDVGPTDVRPTMESCMPRLARRYMNTPNLV